MEDRLARVKREALVEAQGLLYDGEIGLVGDPTAFGEELGKISVALVGAEDAEDDDVVETEEDTEEEPKEERAADSEDDEVEKSEDDEQEKSEPAANKASKPKPSKEKTVDVSLLTLARAVSSLQEELLEGGASSSSSSGPIARRAELDKTREQLSAYLGQQLYATRSQVHAELAANVTSLNDKIDSTKTGLEEELRTGELRQELSKMQ